MPSAKTWSPAAESPTFTKLRVSMSKSLAALHSERSPSSPIAVLPLRPKYVKCTWDSCRNSLRVSQWVAVRPQHSSLIVSRYMLLSSDFSMQERVGFSWNKFTLPRAQLMAEATSWPGAALSKCWMTDSASAPQGTVNTDSAQEVLRMVLLAIWTNPSLELSVMPKRRFRHWTATSRKDSSPLMQYWDQASSSGSSSNSLGMSANS
mmetsp:Transcript_4532/g.10743  ORF Transcript_4532/g.10743 Transcript_4532/m.10743 type:complete len:206 (-) Transcript_4532:877-1494(-)